MQPDAILILQPSVDFKTFLAVSHQALGYSIAASSDQSRRQQHPAERFISCLSAMRDQHAAAGLTPNLLQFVSFAVLIAAEEFDTLEILECAAAMPFMTTETKVRGIQLTVLSGTLSQWRDAVVTGTRRGGTVRHLYCRIQAQFEAQNLNPWTDYTKKWDGDAYLLEDKRK